eukprot:GHVT01088540.1.p1 GENE.GHVT01088540.1~~GHVT01088540.1.p1  ORF type:complete len:226 (-),score=19.43 GHVT01088540.1:1048-1725(-)
MVTVAFLIDIPLQFRTALHSTPVVLRNPQRLAYMYLSSTFLFDVLSALPITVLTGSSQWFCLPRLLKGVRVLSLYTYYKDTGTFPVWVLSAARLVFFFLFTAHSMACVTFVMGEQEATDPSGWMATISDTSTFRLYDRVPWISGSWHSLSLAGKYINCIYFATVTLGTVAYGDLAPTSTLEKVVFIALMALARTVCAFIFAVKVGPKHTIHYSTRSRNFSATKAN